MASAADKAALTQAKESIGKQYATLMNGYMKGDWKVTSQIYGPNCTISEPGRATIKGRDNAERYWRELKEKTGVKTIEIKCQELNGHGDWYFERGSYILHNATGPFEERTYLKVWRRWEGVWYIYTYIFIPKKL